MSESISRWEMTWLCFHSRYGPTSSGKTVDHTLSAAWRRVSHEQVRNELFVPPPKTLQRDHSYVTEERGGGGRDARYNCLQSCNRLPFRTHIFLKDILPLIQMWVYVHWIVVDGNIRNDLPVDCTWYLVCCHTRLYDFLAHDCGQTCCEWINKMCSNYKRVAETYNAPPSFLPTASLSCGIVRLLQPLPSCLVYQIAGQ